MKILAAAQHFGYGPTSNLFTILKGIKEVDPLIQVELLANESTSTFSRNHPGIVNSVVNQIDCENIDAILSSFDPFSILEGWYHNVPTIFYCNLFWFWDVFQCREKLLQYKKDLELLKAESSFSEVLKHFQSIFNANPHHGIFLGYLLATACFIRKFPGIEEKLQILPSDTNYNLTNIMIPQFAFSLPKHVAREPIIIVQLSGGRSPVTTPEENIIYFNFVYKVMTAVAERYPDIIFEIYVNPLTLSTLKFDNVPNISVKPSLSQEENMRAMGTSMALFSPPGTETIYEAAFMQTPLFVFPEQNAVHYPFVKMLRSANYQVDSFLIDDQFPNRKRLPGEDDAHEIYRCLDSVANDQNLLAGASEKAIDFINKVKNKELRSQYVLRIEKSIEKFMGKEPFCSGADIARDILRILRHNPDLINPQH